MTPLLAMALACASPSVPIDAATSDARAPEPDAALVDAALIDGGHDGGRDGGHDTGPAGLVACSQGYVCSFFWDFADSAMACTSSFGAIVSTCDAASSVGHCLRVTSQGDMDSYYYEPFPDPVTLDSIVTSCATVYGDVPAGTWYPR